MTEQFETFMRNYQNMVYSTALRLVVNPAEAEDIAQEVFLKAYERFAELRESPTAASTAAANRRAAASRTFRCGRGAA